MMRRVLFVILAIGIISLALTPNVFAAKFKVPKEGCYTLSSTEGPWPLEGKTLILAFKASGLKVKLGSGTKKFYNIQGALESEGGEFWNTTGSGYVTDEGRFDGHFSSNLGDDGVIIHCNYFLKVSAGMLCTMSPDFAEGHHYSLIEDEEGCKSIDSIN